jgi:hypothetical protein
MRRSLSVFLVVLFSFCARAQEPAKCFEVSTGVVYSVDDPGNKTEVKAGTFCPNEIAKTVAKTLVRLDSEVKEWKIRYDASEEKRIRQEKYTEEIDAIWEKKVKEQDEKIAFLSGFWNKTGRILLWCGVTVVATTITIYGAEKAGVIKW